MLDNVGKVKTKRSKNSKPYERPKSILRRVTDSVTGLLPQPSWLANWLHSSPPEEDDAENDEAEEQPIPSTSSANEENQPAAGGSGKESFIFRKPPGISRDQSNGKTVLHHITLDPIPEPIQTSTGSSLPEISIQTNGDEDSHSESTSGCSSLLPHPEHRRVEVPSAVEPLNIDAPSLRMLGDSLSKSLGADLKNSRGRKTLSLHTFSQDASLGVTPSEDVRFNKESEEGASSSSIFEKEDISSFSRSASKRDLPQPQSSCYGSKRPRFNITSFGTTAMESRKSLLNESIVDSPFYPGRTTYGGASAYRRATLQPSATPFPYIRSRVQARPSSISSAPTTPSGSIPTASKSNVVLSSSAQRILQALEAMSTPVRDAKRIPAATSSRRSTSFQEEEPSFTGFGLSRRRPNLGPPAAKLPIGTPALVVTRHPPATTAAATTATVRTSAAPNGSSSEASIPVSSTPINSQAGGKMRSRISAPVRESVRHREEEVEMSNESELQAVAMPLGLSNLPSFNLLPAPAVATSSVQSTVKQSQPTLVSAVSSFNGITNPSLAASAARPAFTFSAPLVTVSPSAAAAAISSKPPSFNFSSPLIVKTDAAKSSVGVSAPNTVIKPTDELKTGSVLDVLSGSIAPDTLTRSVVTPTSAKQAPPTPIASGFGDKFKPAAGSWTCSVCCVTNSKDKKRCASCESPCPSSLGAQPPTSFAAGASTIALNTPLKGFGDQFKMSLNQWECGVCMVRNPQDEIKCKSCEEPRPGSKPVQTPASVSNFKFGIPATAKDGVSDGGATKLGTELLSNVATKSSSSDGFSFGAAASSQKEIPPTSGFKFGATAEPASKVTPTTGGFQFSAAAEPVKKPDFTFGPTSNTGKNTETSSGFSFGATINTAKTTEVSSGFTFGATINTAKTTEKVEGFKFGASLDQSANKLDESIGSKGVNTGFKLGTNNETVPKPLQFGVISGESIAPTTAATSKVETTSGFRFGTAEEPPSRKTDEPQVLQSVVSVKKTESSTTFGTPTFGLSSSSSHGAGFNATTTTTSSKLNPIFSFGATSVASQDVIGDSGVKPAVTLESGGVMDILGKKTETATVQPATTTTMTNTSVGLTTAAPAFSFGAAEPTKLSFSFTKPAASAIATSTAEAPFAFGSIVPSVRSTEDQPASKSGSFQSTTTQQTPFSFGAATSSASQSLFKPSTAAPSFGGFSGTAPSLFGLTTTTTASTPAPIAFGTPSTTVTVSSSSALPVTTAATSSIFSFGSSSSVAPSTTSASAAPSTGTFSFGLASSIATTVPTVTAAPFSFGSSAPPAYPFGAGTSSTSAAIPPTTTSTVPAVFSFGASSVGTQPSTTSTTTAEAPKTQFSFGAVQASTSTSATPTFGSFGASATKPSAAPFSFGATAPTTSGLSTGQAFCEMTPKSTSTPFGTPSATPFGTMPTSGFGAPAPASTASPFSFGAQPATGTAPPVFSATPSFSFGGSAPAAQSLQPTPTGPIFQFGNTAPVNSNFNFNAGSSFTTPDAPPSAGFASGLFGSNPFDNTGSAVGPNRKIRKAVRRR